MIVVIGLLVVIIFTILCFVVYACRYKKILNEKQKALEVQELPDFDAAQ